MTDLRKAAEMALEVMEYNRANGTPNMGAAIQALRQALAQPEQEPAAFVYKATNHYGETAHFGVRSAAKAWAKNGTVKAVPIKNLKLVQKPCSSCESLARTVMLDQTYHESIMTKREWVGLTDEEVEAWRGNYDFFDSALVREVEAKLKEKNT